MPTKYSCPAGSCVSPWKYLSGTESSAASAQRPGVAACAAGTASAAAAASAMAMRRARMAWTTLAAPPLPSPTMSIERLDAAGVRPLRQVVLRPHQRAEELVYPGDDDPRTLHA